MWPRLQLQAARYFMALLIAQWLWEWGYLLETIATTIETARLWDNVQFLPYLLVSPAWLYLSRSLANMPLFRGVGHPLFTFAFPLAFMIALGFDQQLEWIRIQSSLSFENNQLLYEFGPLMYLSVLWMYGLVFVSLNILISSARNTHKTYRLQILAIIFGVFLPLLLSVPTLLGYTIFGLNDISPFSFAVGNLAIVYGLFRLHAFEYQLVTQLPVISQLPIGIIVLDHRGRIIEWNPLALKMLGIHFDTPGIHSSTLPIANLLNIGEDTLWTHKNRTYEIQYQQLTTNEKLSSSIISITDLTVQYDQKRSLEITNKALSDLLDELTETQERVLESEKHQTIVSLIQSLAHEFNTPLGNLTTLIDGFQETDHPEEYAPLIKSNVIRVIQLIERIKQISTVSTDSQLESFNLKIAIEEIIQGQRYYQGATVVEFVTDISPSVILKSSRLSLENVLVQLIENSRQHAFKNVEHPTIRIVATQSQENFVLEYCDNGCGIPEELEKQLFLPFSNYSTRMSITSGIGLFSVHQWVTQSLKGRISYFQKQNSGACFKITCPLVS
jgi:signal transduction histidine kinase